MGSFSAAASAAASAAVSFSASARIDVAYQTLARGALGVLTWNAAASGMKVCLIDAAFLAAHIRALSAPSRGIKNKVFSLRVAAAFDTGEALVIEIEKVAIATLCFGSCRCYSVCRIVAMVRQRSCNGLKSCLGTRLVG